MKKQSLQRICAGVLAITMSGIITNTSLANQSEEETVAVVDMYSIPEEYRTVDNFGPGFKDGVPVDKIEGIELAPVENINPESAETSTETTEESVEVLVVSSPVITIDQVEDNGNVTESSSVAETVAPEVTMVEKKEQQLPTTQEIAKKVAPELEVSTQHVVDNNTPAVGNRWGISLTQEEKNLLAQIVYLEAGGEPDSGEQAVVEVIFNRMYGSSWPNTLYGVLSQRRQFSTWPYRHKAKVSAKEFRNIDIVLNGQTNFFPYKTVYFSTKPQNKRIQSRLGGHYFCNE